MKDIITSISGLVALLVFVYCMWTGADFETTIWKSVLIFIVTNLIAYAAFGVTTVTMNSNQEPEEEDLLDKMEETSDSETTSEEAAVNA